MASNYVVLEGNLLSWEVRDSRARGWVEVQEGGPNFPLVSFEANPVWEGYVGSYVRVSGRLTWALEDFYGEQRMVVNVHVDALERM